jgi:hypothetical protein
MAMNLQKKIFIQTLIAATLFFFPLFGLCESKHNIKVQVNYFYPSEKSFQNIYGSGLALGGEMNFKVWKSIYLWLFGSYYSKNGNLPITQEKTKMTLIPVGGGIKLKFQTGIVSPYIGLGPVVYFYEENNPIGAAKGTHAGFIGQAGLSLKIMGRLFFDFSINYSYCKVKPQNIKADIGGIQTGLGIGFMF